MGIIATVGHAATAREQADIIAIVIEIGRVAAIAMVTEIERVAVIAMVTDIETAAAIGMIGA